MGGRRGGGRGSEGGWGVHFFLINVTRPSLVDAFVRLALYHYTWFFMLTYSTIYQCTLTNVRLSFPNETLSIWSKLYGSLRKFTDTLSNPVTLIMKLFLCHTRNVELNLHVGCSNLRNSFHLFIILSMHNVKKMVKYMFGNFQDHAWKR